METNETNIEKDNNHLQKELARLRQQINNLEKAEAECHRVEDRIRTMLDNIVMGVSLITPKMEILWLNKTMQGWFPNIDVKKRPLCYQSFYSPPKEKVCEYCPVVRTFKTGVIHSSETPVCVNGRMYNVYAVPVKDENGEITYVVETVEDITERKKTEESLHESEEKFKSLCEQSPNMIFINKAGKVLYANVKCEEITGYKRDEFYASDFDYLCLIAPEYKELIKSNFEKHMKGEEIESYEYALITKDGRRIDAIITTKLINYDGGRAILGIVTDITEHKQAEKALHQERDLVSRIMETSPVGITVVNREGQITFANAQAEKVLGLTKDKIKQRTYNAPEWRITDFYGNPFPDAELPFQRVMNTCKPVFDVRHAIELPDGRQVLLSINGAPLFDKSGQIMGMVATAEDITERKRMEEELKQSFKRLRKTFEETASALSFTLEKRDPFTAGHQQRVAQLACAIAKEIGLSEKQIEGIHIAGILHDIGKISVPAEILSKPGKITDGEFIIIKTHPQIGDDILMTIEFPWPIGKIVLQHHERLDGSGYPQGLKANEILLEARILGVADVVEAITSFRPYRVAQGIDKALEEIIKNKGILYDLNVVDACVRLFTEKGFKFE